MSVSDIPANAGPVTLQNVADAAGVSVSTASRALNGQARKYRIRASTEEAVRKAASRLGFQASQIARSLRLKRSGLIGVIVPDISNPFFASIAREVSLGVEAEGYSVLLGDSREQTSIERRLAMQLRARQIEALLVCSVGAESKHLIELDQSGLPVVLVDRVFEGVDLPSVTSDNVKAAEDLAGVLIDHGHRRIGVLAGVSGSLPTRTRLLGLRRAAEAAGFSIGDSFVAGDAFTEASGYAATKELMQRNPQITALFAMCTPAAMGALKALSDSQVSVPEDVSIVAFDDHPFGDLMKTPLTVAAQDIDQLGKLATTVLIDRLKSLHLKSLPSPPHSSKSDPSLTGSADKVMWKVQTTLRKRASVMSPRN